MKTKLAHHLLLAVASTFALSVSAFASHDHQPIDIKIKGISSGSQTAKAFRQNPSEAYRTVEALLKEKADEATDLENTTIKAKVPLFSATAQAFYQDPASALSTLEAALLQKAEEATNRHQRTFKLIVNRGTATERAFNSDSLEVIYAIERAFVQAEEAQQAAIEGEELTSQALDGDYSAVRELARRASDDKTALKWYFVELLMSFGESFQYQDIVQHAGELSPKVVDRALVEAAQWLSTNRYNNDVLDEDGPDGFSQIFNEYFKNRSVEAFFFHAEKLDGPMARLSYLQFFKWLGIEEVNLTAAKRCLLETAKTNHSAARDLDALLAHFRNTEGVAERQALLSTAITSKRPVMQYIKSRLLGEEALQPYQNSFEDSIASLRKTLKINE